MVDNESTTEERTKAHGFGTEAYVMMDMTSVAVNDDVVFELFAESEVDRVLKLSRLGSIAGLTEDENLVER